MLGVVVAPLPARPEYITAETASDGVRCAESSYPPGLAIPEHVHDRGSITIILSGSFVEAQGRTARANCVAGSAVLRGPGEPHANQIEGAGALNLEIELGARLASACELNQLRSSVVVHPAIASAAGRLRGELRVRDRAHAMIVEGLSLEIAGHAVRQSLVDVGRHPPRWLRRAHERLRDACLEEISTSDLAREVGVHPVSLARGFRMHFGISPGAFVRSQRIAWAAEELVRAPDSPVTEIALAAGFYDHSHFARVFRQQMGRSPGEYRRALLGRPTVLGQQEGRRLRDVLGRS